MQSLQKLPFLLGVTSALAVALAFPPTWAQQDAEQVDSLIRQEQFRETVQLAVEAITSHQGSGDSMIDLMIGSAAEMRDAGPETIPFLASELQQKVPKTFFFSAYALAQFDTPEAREALDEALAQADREDGDYGVARKGWTAFTMGLQRRPEAILLINEGRRLAGHYPIHSRLSAVESIAIQTAPECVPLIADELERLDGDTEDHVLMERKMLIKALGWPRDPAAVPILLSVLDDSHWSARFEAARSLGRIGTREAVEGLLSLLDDEEFIVRRTVATQLDTLLPADKVDLVVARLDEEEDDVVRGYLYRSIARTLGTPSIEILGRHWPRIRATDREHLVTAVDIAGGVEAIPILRAALSDESNKVAIYGLHGLERVDAPEARELVLDSLSSPRWPIAQTAIDSAIKRGDDAAATIILERLTGDEMSIDILDTGRRARAMTLASALVELDHTTAIDSLRKALERQNDARLIDDIENVLSRLELIKNNGNEREAWLALLDHDDPRHRALAYSKLAQIGGEESAKALRKRFGRVGLADGVEILRYMGKLDAPASRALIRRVLTDAAFDPADIIGLREMAAWSARRLGGDDMRDALFESVRRRDGRDGLVLIYAAVLGSEEALPLLTEIRPLRMRYPKWVRGLEQDRLDLVERELRRGRSLADHDLPPESIRFR